MSVCADSLAFYLCRTVLWHPPRRLRVVLRSRPGLRSPPCCPHRWHRRRSRAPRVAAPSRATPSPRLLQRPRAATVTSTIASPCRSRLGPVSIHAGTRDPRRIRPDGTPPSLGRSRRATRRGGEQSRERRGNLDRSRQRMACRPCRPTVAVPGLRIRSARRPRRGLRGHVRTVRASMKAAAQWMAPAAGRRANVADAHTRHRLLLS